MDLRCVHAHALIAIISANRRLDILRHLSRRVQLSLETVLKNKLGPCTQFDDADIGMWQPTTRARVTDDVEEEPSRSAAVAGSTVTFERPENATMDGILPPFRVRAHYLDTITNSKFCTPHGTRRVFDRYDGSIDPGDDQHASLFSPSPESTLRYGGHYECPCLTAEFAGLPLESFTSGISGSLRHMGKYAWLVDYFRTSLQPLDTTTEADSSAFVVDLRDDATSSINLADLRAFGEIANKYLLQRRTHVFTTKYSVGFAGSGFEDGDEIFAIDGVSVPFVLRRVEPRRQGGEMQYEIVGECYLWAALHLDCWIPGSRKGRWLNDYSRRQHPNEVEGQTRMIKIDGGKVKEKRWFWLQAKTGS